MSTGAGSARPADVARSLAILAGLLIVSGAVFVGQGLGLLRGSSFMVDDIRWSWIGGTLIAIGVALAARLWRRRRAGTS